MKPRSQAKTERLARALRENLKRRKTRARAVAGKDAKAPRGRPNLANKSDLT
jgi:hypothetical protein